MFASSTEAPEVAGLGIFAGECEHFPAEVKSPHVGWNQLHFAKGSRLLRDIDEIGQAEKRDFSAAVRAALGPCQQLVVGGEQVIFPPELKPLVAAVGECPDTKPAESPGPPRRAFQHGLAGEQVRPGKAS